MGKEYACLGLVTTLLSYQDGHCITLRIKTITLVVPPFPDLVRVILSMVTATTGRANKVFSHCCAENQLRFVLSRGDRRNLGQFDPKAQVEVERW